MNENNTLIMPQTYLRPLRQEDAADIVGIIDTQREYLGRWLPFVAATRSVADSQAYVASVTESTSENSDKVFAIICDDSFAGIVGIKSIHLADMALNRIQISCAVGNMRSSNVAKRLGFTFEGIERAGEFAGGKEYFDIEIYSLLRSEYKR